MLTKKNVHLSVKAVITRVTSLGVAFLNAANID